LWLVRIYLYDSRPDLANRNFDCVGRSERVCANRLFGVLEEVQLRGHDWRQSDSFGDDEISAVDAIFGKGCEDQIGFTAPLR